MHASQKNSCAVQPVSLRRVLRWQYFIRVRFGLAIALTTVAIYAVTVGAARSASATGGQARPSHQLVRAAYEAVSAGNLAGLSHLVSLGASVNRQYMDGETLLMCAAVGGKVAIGRFLISRGAYVDAADGLGITPLGLAAMNDRIEMAKLLLSHGAKIEGVHQGYPPLRLAAEHGVVNAVRLLMRAGAQINARDTMDGDTALIAAARQGHAQVVKILLAGGANVKAANRQGETAIKAATVGHHSAVLALLMEQR